MLDFEKVIPEDVGISSTRLISFARKLECNNLPDAQHNCYATW